MVFIKSRALFFKDLSVTLLFVAMCALAGWCFGSLVGVQPFQTIHEYISPLVFFVGFTVVSVAIYFGLYSHIEKFKYQYMFSTLSVETCGLLLNT